MRFIFSWDDYDTFRKIPQNMPQQEKLQEFLFQPIVDTPDPYGQHQSYAAHHEHHFERQLERVGIGVEPLYQAKKYRNLEYAQQIEKVLHKREAILEILNQHRKEAYDENHIPVSIYCQNCNTDHQITQKKWHPSEGEISYHCQNCGHQGRESVAQSTRLKLPWRLDWPMRWSFEKVDFEPGGKGPLQSRRFLYHCQRTRQII